VGSLDEISDGKRAEARREKQGWDAKAEKGDKVHKETNIALHKKGNWRAPGDDSVLLKNWELKIVDGGFEPLLATKNSVSEFQMRDGNQVSVAGVVLASLIAENVVCIVDGVEVHQFRNSQDRSRPTLLLELVRQF
jgi:hypothetical protein